MPRASRVSAVLQTGEVYILPTIRINGGQYRGKLSYKEVLQAVCAGFNKNNEPAACNRVGEDDCRVDALGYQDCAARSALKPLTLSCLGDALCYQDCAATSALKP